jgi:nucleotide-binding universal stress UspA family protein
MGSTLFERILVPTDLTHFSDPAVAHARLFQRRLGSKITLMYADEISWLAAQHPIGYYIDNIDERKRELESRLAEFAKHYEWNGPPVETKFVDDQPAHAIIRAADEIDADLIIMDTHARHGRARAFLGSVTERVLRDATRPVLTVVPGVMPAPSLRSVLCPVNFTAVARAALEQAAVLADAFDAQLIVVHVVEGELPLVSNVSETFANWVDPLVRGRTRYEQVISHGDPSLRVTETAEAVGASVIVIGAQHKILGDSTVVGSSTGRIIRAATRPVLTIVQRPAMSKAA